MLTGFSKTFYVLKLESHTSEKLIAGGFRSLLEADFYDEKEGDLHSAFLQLSTGIERMLKIALVSHRMLACEYTQPMNDSIKKTFGHDLLKAYHTCTSILREQYSVDLKLGDDERAILDFLNNFANGERYFHLNEVEKPTNKNDPVSKWIVIVRKIHESRFTLKRSEKIFRKILQSLDGNGIGNRYTHYTDITGHPLLTAEVMYSRETWKRNVKYIILSVIRMLKPIRELLILISERAAEFENIKGIRTMVIPSYDDYFTFVLLDHESALGRRQWSSR